MILGTLLIASIYHQLLTLDSADMFGHVIVPINGTPVLDLKHKGSAQPLWFNICSAPIKLVNSECLNFTFYQYFYQYSD